MIWFRVIKPVSWLPVKTKAAKTAATLISNWFWLLSPFSHKNTHRKLHAKIKQAVDLPNSREIFPQGVGEQVTAIASSCRSKFAETTNVASQANHHPSHPSHLFAHRPRPAWPHTPSPAYLSPDSNESCSWAELERSSRRSRLDARRIS